MEGKRKEGEGSIGEDRELGGRGRSRIKQRDQWGWATVSVKASANPMWRWKAEIALPKCPESEHGCQVFIPYVNQSLDVECHKKGV